MLPVQEVAQLLSATALFLIVLEDCERIATSSNVSFKAISKVQRLNGVDKLLATTANAVLCLLAVKL